MIVNEEGNRELLGIVKCDTQATSRKFRAVQRHSEGRIARELCNRGRVTLANETL